MLGQILPLICAIIYGPSPAVVVPASLLARLIITFITYIAVLRIEWPVRLLDFDPAWVRRLLGYGSCVSVSSIASPVVETFDQMLISSVLGASAVAQYSMPMNLSMRSQVVATALARSLFPRMWRSSPEEARRTTQAAVVSLAYGFGAICGPGILFSGLFLRLWVGTKFAVVSTPMARVLMLGAWTNGLAFLPYGLLQGQGRPDITAKLHVAQVLPFLLGDGC